MSVDPTLPLGVPPVAPTTPVESDLDPDAGDDEDAAQELKELKEQRPEDWNEPPAAKVPGADDPTPLSDDLR